MLWPKTNSYKEFDNEENSCGFENSQFLRGQVSSNGFKVVNGGIVEPWILLVRLQINFRILVFRKGCDSTIFFEVSRLECPHRDVVIDNCIKKFGAGGVPSSVNISVGS